MLRHHNITHHKKTISKPGPLQRVLKEGSHLRVIEKRLSPKTTESHKVQITPLLFSNQAPSHVLRINPSIEESGYSSWERSLVSSQKSQSSTKPGAPRPDSRTWVSEAARSLREAIHSDSISPPHVRHGSPKSQSSIKLGAPRPDSRTWVSEAARSLREAIHFDSISLPHAWEVAQIPQFSTKAGAPRPDSRTWVSKRHGVPPGSHPLRLDLTTPRLGGSPNTSVLHQSGCPTSGLSDVGLRSGTVPPGSHPLRLDLTAPRQAW